MGRFGRAALWTGLSLPLLTGFWIWAQSTSTVNFSGKELLGRPTDTSVTINVAADRDLEVYFEYGISPATYTAQTVTTRYAGGTPFNALIDHLKADTRYYYRMRYREPGQSTFVVGLEHSFRTQRPRGSTFTFAIQADPHMDENSDAGTYQLTLQNMLASAPDFLVDLGDTFMSDKLQPITQPAILDRVLLLRSYYDLIGHSVPLFLGLGNHEGEWGRNLNGNGQNVAVWDTLARKQYFPNPLPDGFFSGDTQAYSLVGQRQSYYAWEWGDALFAMLDPFWSLPVAPETGGDWSLTLGRAQYEWLKKTLETSTATYKFVFAHNLVGGVNPNGLGPMRGGVEVAKYLEWGGSNLNDTWGFDQARPGWAMPIHQLLVANNVTAFFHGHDHLYAKQDLDGIVYQEAPQPSAKNTNLGTRGSDYGYVRGTLLGGTGYLRVQVSPANVRVEYVETWIPGTENGIRKNGMVADSYTVAARRTSLRSISAASYAGGTVAAESVVAAFGTNMGSGPVTVKDSAGIERTAEIVGSSSTQVNFIVPKGTAVGRAQLTVAGGSTGAPVAIGDLLIDPVAPGLFSANFNGSGVAAGVALHVLGDGSQSSEVIFQCGQTDGSCTAIPIDLGSAADRVYLSLYGTGIRNGTGLGDISVTIGGQKATVLYAGPQTQYAGLDQVNVQVPRTAPRGEVSIQLTVAGKNANPVTVALR
jgi:uncharacterized protein (TIGR03437 family)